MALTIIRNRLITPEQIARHPRKVRGGWMFTHPPKDLWRYNRHARNQAIREWASYGAAALASIVGGGMVGMAAVADEPTGIPSWGLTLVGTPNYNATQLDAAGEYRAIAFKAPKTGSLRSFEARINTATGSPTADFQFESVDMGTFLPSGVVLGATNSASALGVACSVAWLDPGNFTEDVSVTKGDWIYAVIRYVSGTLLTTAAPLNTNFRLGMCPTTVSVGGSTVMSPATQMVFAIKYSDGTYPYIPYAYPNKDTTWVETYGNATNPNHRGNVYTNPTPRRAMGGWFTHPQAAVDTDLIIASDAWDGTADDDGTSNLHMLLDNDESASLALLIFMLSDQTLTMDAGTDYRAIVKPTSATAVNLYRVEVNSAAIFEQMGHTNCRYTSANNPTGAGDWTDSTTKRAFCGFWVDQVDDGAGGGGGGGPLISGRLIR